MATKALIEKAKKKPKFSTRKVNRCLVCGRSRGRLRLERSIICRIHFLQYVRDGMAPGFRKASW